jgi:hypothetical protein
MMKKLAYILTLTLVTLSGCKFVNERILGREADTLGVYTANLEKQLAGIESEHFYEMEKLKMESQSKIDSIINYYESELSGKGRRYTGAVTGTFYIIVGSFKTPGYANAWSAKVTAMGYPAEIIPMRNWSLVTTGSYTSLRKASGDLEKYRTAVSPDSWIYVAR